MRWGGGRGGANEGWDVFLWEVMISKDVAQAAGQGFRVSLLLLLPDTHYAMYFNWLA